VRVVTRDEVVAARTADWSESERAALAPVVDALRPSPHHLTDILDWLEDVAARDGVRPAAILATPSLQAALAFRGSAPDRLKRWKDALRRLRYPRLAVREQEFQAAVRALDLGRAIAITPPAAFEGGTITITMRAGSAAELDASLERLERGRRSGALARLFDVLD
jgi:hypothetical protein